MATKSIGVLTAFINADAAGLMRAFDQVDRRLARASADFTKPGAKLALGFLGVENALKAVSNEVRFVVQNIESIPGVPAETQASIITMRDNLAAAKHWIDQMTAGIIGFGAQAAQAVGAGMAGLAGYDDASGLGRQETPDEIARAKDQGFDAKMDSARKKLSDMRKASELAGKTDVEQIIALRKEAEGYETFSKSKSINTVQRLEAETEAQERLAKAAEKMKGLNSKLDDSSKAVSKSMTGKFVATLPRGDAISGLENRSSELFGELQKTPMKSDDPSMVKKRTDLNEELADVQERLGKLYEKNQKSAENFAGVVAAGFTKGIFAGESFGDMMKGLALEIAQVIVKQVILNTVMAMMGGGAAGGSALGSILGGFFAEGGRPPMGKISVVGEKGPELFVPDSAGRIIPNSALRGGGDREASGSNATHSFVFSPQIASGVTRPELSALMPQMFERFAAMVADKSGRGGAYRKSFA